MREREGESRRRQKRGRDGNGGGNSGMIQLIISQSLFGDQKAVRQILSPGHSNLGIPSTEYSVPTATGASNASSLYLHCPYP